MTALILFGAIAVASSDSSSRAEAERLYAAAEQEERDLDFASALAHYEASIQTDPSNRWALRSSARARWLHDRSEGDFAPLVKLERARRDPNAQANAALVDGLARDLEAFPPGEVRTEARMFVAESYASKLARPADAERELDALLDEPKSDVPLRAQAASRLVDLATERGDATAAKHAAARAGKSAPDLVARVARWTRRRFVFRASIGVLVVFGVLGIAASARKLRGASARSMLRFAPKAALICVYLATFAAVLATAYERGHATPFLALPAAMFPIILVARAWGLAGAHTRAARVGRAIVSVAAVASAAFIVLYGIDVRYLESFGL